MLIPIGGEGTLTAARMLADAGMPVVGVPKTIDNDINGTDRTFGFDTAVTVATEAMDRLKTTAESHQRVMVVEVMGRHAGWIALEAGMAGGAHGICVPERPFEPDDLVDDGRGSASRAARSSRSSASPRARTRPRARWTYGVGEIDKYGHERFAGIGTTLADASWRRGSARRPGRSSSGTSSAAGCPRRTTGCWPPASGGTRSRPPTRASSGNMTALHGTTVSMVPLADAVTHLKTVPEDRMDEAESVF